MKELRDILGAVRSGPGRRWMLATLVGVRGSSYRQPGARLLMDAEGPVLGAISGGCLEGDVFARAKEALASGAPRLIDYDLRGDLDLIWGSGSGCDGEARILVEALDPAAPWLAFAEARLEARAEARIAIRLGPGLGERVCGERDLQVEEAFVEPILPPLALFIFGAGDEVKPLVALAGLLGWTVTVCDHRPAFAKPERFPQARVQAGHPAQVIPRLALDARSAAVLLSHNYVKDAEALRLLMEGPAPYLGLMGHRQRAARLVEELEAEGVPVDRARLFAPVGLDLGAESPETLALAIASEIQAVFGGREGGCLRDRRAAIHGARG
ncbi:MAG TPA: XdhC family protein [Holophagaceae bacterium]|nr:XdhC family protein [Holophagaceae bacterium]